MRQLEQAHERIQELYSAAAFRAADRGDREAVSYWLGRMDKADRITDVHRQLAELGATP